jgi:hypothetical protein
MEEILVALRRIDERIESLENKISVIHDKCDKMEKHINFVDSVYERVKTPFHFIMNRVASVISYTALRAESVEDRTSIASVEDVRLATS